MYEWTNSREEAVIGTGVCSVVGAGFYNEREHYFYRVLAGEQVTFEQSSVLAGQHRVIQSTYIPDIDPDGDIVGFYTMRSDISSMKNRVGCAASGLLRLTDWFAKSHVDV